MKRKLAVISLMALALVGCASPGGPLEPAEPAEPDTIGSGWDLTSKLYSETIILPDGREVTCVVLSNSAKDYSYGGLSCDWDTANGLFLEER